MNHETAAIPVVLIVDDDAQTRLLVTETLEQRGIWIENNNPGQDSARVQRRGTDYEHKLARSFGS
jgi:CheY-like chemotaxis protein